MKKDMNKDIRIMDKTIDKSIDKPIDKNMDKSKNKNIDKEMIKEDIIKKDKYNYKNWNNKFPNGFKFYMLNIPFHWLNIFQYCIYDKRIKNIEDIINNGIKSNKMIFPFPDLIFRTFMLLHPNNLKVVIIGQDPYIEWYDDVPEATGISFSTPIGIKKPSSVNNIHLNLLKYNHIKKIPKYGNLEKWNINGCLMLNSALTVFRSDKRSHYDEWEWFTDIIIQKISEKFNKLILVLWGGDALRKVNIIDINKHNIIVSSHPSGLSCDRPLRNFPAFSESDHFGKINEILIKNGKSPIDWNVFDS